MTTTTRLECESFAGIVCVDTKACLQCKKKILSPASYSFRGNVTRVKHTMHVIWCESIYILWHGRLELAAIIHRPVCNNARVILKATKHENNQQLPLVISRNYIKRAKARISRLLAVTYRTCKLSRKPKVLKFPVKLLFLICLSAKQCESVM